MTTFIIYTKTNKKFRTRTAKHRRIDKVGFKQIMGENSQEDYYKLWNTIIIIRLSYIEAE